MLRPDDRAASRRELVLFIQSMRWGLPDNDTACEDNCLAATSAEGYNQSVELGLCLNRSNCEDDDLACLERECMNQIEACFGPLPRGMGTCLELNTCLSDCADDDAACSRLVSRRQQRPNSKSFKSPSSAFA